MTTKLAKTERRIARPLNVLIPLIQEELEAGNTAGLEHYRQAGQYLLEVRESGQVAPYKWGAWLSKNFTLSRSTAGRYMRLASLEVAPAAGATLLQAIGEPQPKSESHRRVGGWTPIREFTAKIDTERLAQERQTIETEVRLHREIAADLIDAGYRALATRLHPDTGGSRDAMRRLNRVRDELKSFAKSRRFE